MLDALSREQKEKRPDHPQEDEPRTKRNRMSISLSDKSVQAFKEIKQMIDADTDSEVVRNALRLYLGVLRAKLDGKTLLLRDEKSGVVQPIELFPPL
jgi:hypothetical protein